MSAIAETSGAVRARAARRGLDRFDASVLALLCLLSLWVVGSDLVLTLIQERRWTHTDGFYSGDQLQYLSWIQSSASHGLISNLFVLRHTPADYFQPAIMLSALLVRIGMASWLSLMLWKPVAVLALFFATRAVADHCGQRTFDRRAVLVLGLFFGSLTEFSGQLGVFGDMMSTWQSWGYPFGLIGVALILYAMLGYSRARDERRVAWWPGLLGALAGTLHPWQGEMMFGCLVLAELARTRDSWRRVGSSARSAGTGPVRAAWRDPVLRLATVTIVLVALPAALLLRAGPSRPRLEDVPGARQARVLVGCGCDRGCAAAPVRAARLSGPARRPRRAADADVAARDGDHLGVRDHRPRGDAAARRQRAAAAARGAGRPRGAPRSPGPDRTRPLVGAARDRDRDRSGHRLRARVCPPVHQPGQRQRELHHPGRVRRAQLPARGPGCGRGALDVLPRRGDSGNHGAPDVRRRLPVVRAQLRRAGRDGLAAAARGAEPPRRPPVRHQQRGRASCSSRVSRAWSTPPASSRD